MEVSLIENHEFMIRRTVMPNFVPITLAQHSARRWQRRASYAFAVRETVVSVVLSELPKAMMSLPIAFIKQAEEFVPVAVLGLQPGKNLFVAPDGRWLGGYIPALLRGYPFRLASAKDGQQLLCIDDDCGLITDGPEGESFFTADGAPAPAVMEIMNFYIRIEEARALTVNACRMLAKHQILRPWVITINTAAGKQELTGLFQIDEIALNSLSGDAFLELSQASALLVAYCQLLSVQHLPVLGKLAEARAKAFAPPTPAKVDLDLEYLNRDGTLHFGNLV